MEITQIRVFPVEDEKLKAFVSIIFDDCFVVSDIKIIDGVNGLFVSMPSKKRKNGTFRDIAHPLNNETRRMIEEKIVKEYKQNVQGSSADSGTRIRELGAQEDSGMKSPDTDERKAGNDSLEGGDRSWT
jgi:stage V sporulation protein G